MGKVSFKYGTASQLTNAPYSEGTFYVISDSGSTDGILYADLNNKRICFGDVASLEDDVSELSSSIPTKISELIDDSDFIKQYYGTCGTTADTVQKEVTINSITELTTGLTIFVKFTYTNTAANPTLKLNNFDTKYIKRYGTTAPSTSAASSWNAGAIVCLTYDGTYWYLNDWNNTTYSAMSESEMKTGTATTARNITAARLKQAVEYHAPVSSVNGQTGEVTINIPTVPTNVSDFTNDAGYLTSYTETDPTVPSWAKASTKPSYNFSEIGSTPTTINGYGITDAYTKTQVDGLVAGVLHYKGTKAAVSNLPTSGNTTGDTWHITADGSEWAWDGTTWQELGTAVDLSDYVTTDDSRLSDARTPTAHNQALSTITGADDLKAIEALSGTSGLLKKTAANTWTLDTSNYLTSYTETDPVFFASAAAGITSTDISNWNAKVSDDKTWNGITLNKTFAISNSTIYVPYTTTSSNSTTEAKFNQASTTPGVYTIAMYDGSLYLHSTTPSANDNSTKVATTAYVDNAIPKVYSSTNTSGYLTMATLPIYDGTVV